MSCCEGRSGERHARRRADLRRALEQEFRAKLLRLRQAFALQATDPQALGEVAARSVASVAALFRVALALHGRPVPSSTPECLAAAGAAFGVATGPVIELWRARQAMAAPCSATLFEGYLAAVAAAVRVTDQFTSGATDAGPGHPSLLSALAVTLLAAGCRYNTRRRMRR
jgi:hypothetical protein